VHHLGVPQTALPPADGGVCDIVVTLTDGTTVTIHADWGQPVRDGCCGGFSKMPSSVTITTPVDAGVD
jgi:hypothetical protein